MADEFWFLDEVVNSKDNEDGEVVHEDYGNYAKNEVWGLFYSF